MRKSVWYATKDTGEGWVPDRPEVFAAFMVSIPPGEKLEITIQNPQVDKTLPQLKKYYAGPVKALMEYGPYTKQEADGILKREFLRRNEGTKAEYTASKTDLTKDEMREFIDASIMWLTSNGLFIEETS